MPPKRKEVSSAAAEQTGRQTRASSRATSSTSSTVNSTSNSRSPDTSSGVVSSRGTTRARAASQSTASSKTSRAESTSQSPTSSDSIIARSSRSSNSVSGNSISRDTASSSQSPSSSVSSTVRNSQPASASKTEAQIGHIRQLGPSVTVTKLTTFRPTLAGSTSASTSSSNRSTNEAANSTTPSTGVPRSSQDVIDQPVSAQDGTSSQPRESELSPVSSQDGTSTPSPEDVTSTFPRVVELGDVRVFRLGSNVISNTAAAPEVPISSQDVLDQPVSAQDRTDTPPRGAESRNGVFSPELDDTVISVTDEENSFQTRANVSVNFDLTVDLTSPLIVRTRAVPVFRSLSESLMQQDQLDDFSELTLTSPPGTPPRMNLLMTHPQNNLADMTIDLTDSPMSASAPSASSEQNSHGPALGSTAPSTSPEQNSLGSAPGSTSHIRCPVCLDNLPQITSTGRNLMSTVCGHVFCSSCLPLCIRSNGRCPSCRKVLRPNQMHPIFI